uniref:Uncharacterized protein n=1 Tax=Oryza glumipatula TaxID=40148 RepID=A0A0E0ASM8_9ORYZ
MNCETCQLKELELEPREIKDVLRCRRCRLLPLLSDRRADIGSGRRSFLVHRPTHVDSCNTRLARDSCDYRQRSSPMVLAAVELLTAAAVSSPAELPAAQVSPAGSWN